MSIGPINGYGLNSFCTTPIMNPSGPRSADPNQNQPSERQISSAGVTLNISDEALTMSAQAYAVDAGATPG